MLKIGNNGMYKLWSVAKLSQNKKKKMRLAKIEERNQFVILENDNLDIREELSINIYLN